MKRSVLAVDTAGPVLSVAVQKGDEVFHASLSSAKPHDETLWPLIEKVLAKAKLKRADLSAIVAASGPGRFTGIRIGMSFAAVAASRLKIPALAVSRLEGLAWRLPKGAGAAAIPGWKGERYYQSFARGKSPKKTGEPAWVSEAEWSARAAELKKDGAALVEAEADARDLLPAAAAVLARKKKPAFAPLYLKPAGYEKIVR